MAAELQEARELGLLADSLASAGLLAEALIQQRAAIEAYRGCLNTATDPMLQTTVRMMIADHSKAARDLERRIVEGSNQPKARPEPNRRERALPAIPSSMTPHSHSESSGRSQATPPRMNSFGRSSRQVDFDPDTLFRSPAPTRTSSGIATPVQSTPVSPSASRIVRNDSSAERSGTEGSYMFPPDSDPQDSVTVFLTAIEGMLDQFDQPLNLPLAFATAPLSPQAASGVPRGPAPFRTARAPPNQARPYKPAVSSSETGEDDSDSDSSFFMIPSSSPTSSTASLHSSVHKYPPNAHQSITSSTSTSSTARGSVGGGALRDENAKLFQQVQELTTRLARAEGLIRAQFEKDQAMRNSVMVLRRETQRMAASTTLGPGRPSLFSQMAPSLQASLLAPTIPSPTPTPTPTPVPSLSTPQRPSTSTNTNANPRRAKSTSTSSAVSDHISTSPQPSTSISPSMSSPSTSAPYTAQTTTVTSAPQSHFNILNPSVDVATLGRIKDLESQLQTLKAENEHQKAQIARYRERWQKLKDNARRKQKLATQDASGIANGYGGSEKIPEEDEGGRSD